MAALAAGPVQDALADVIRFVPRLILFAVILVLGWLVARWLRAASNSLLRRVGFDQAVERGGVGRALGNTPYDARGIVTTLIYYAVLLFTLQLAFGIWGPNPVSDLISGIVAWLPKAFVAILIIVVATTIAAAVRKVIGGALGGLSYGRLLAKLAGTFIVGLGIIAALDQIGVATSVTTPVLVAILATVGGILVVGVGGGLVRPMQGRWESWLSRAELEQYRMREHIRVAAEQREAEARAQAEREEAARREAQRAEAAREAAEARAAREAAEAEAQAAVERAEAEAQAAAERAEAEAQAAAEQREAEARAQAEREEAARREQAAREAAEADERTAELAREQEAAQAEAARQEAAREEQAAQADAAQTTAVQMTAVPVEPVQAEPVQAEPVQAEPVQAEPVQEEAPAKRRTSRPRTVRESAEQAAERPAEAEAETGTSAQASLSDEPTVAISTSQLQNLVSPGDGPAQDAERTQPITLPGAGAAEDSERTQVLPAQQPEQPAPRSAPRRRRPSGGTGK